MSNEDGTPELTEAEKAALFDKIARIVSIQIANNEDDEGDKYLSSPGYAMEAISAVIDGAHTGILRQFEEAGA